MLKIKDNVDLKELEKYGFNCIDENYIWNEEASISICIKNPKCRTLYVYGQDEDDYQDLGVIYDLVKADIVEKVE